MSPLADAAALQVVLEGVPGARLHRVGAARVVEGHAGHQVGPELLGHLRPEWFTDFIPIFSFIYSTSCYMSYLMPSDFRPSP